MKIRRLFMGTVALVMLLTSCGDGTQSDKTVKPYDDISHISNNGKTVYEKSEYDKEYIITYTFNDKVVFKGNEKLQAEIMERGKNPGLGVRSLHEQGITGKGVNVAIIDDSLILGNPEFTDKIAAYHNAGRGQGSNIGSKHAPGVTSLLVGESMGVAPDAMVYFVAYPPWTENSKFAADGLYWIIEENKKLPEDEKIRVISVSAALSGEGSPFTMNTEMWDEAVLAAQNEGILILDCRIGEDTGIIYPAYYDLDDPDNIYKCKGGFPNVNMVVPASGLGVPSSRRTVAGEHNVDNPSYVYYGEGGLSWSIPYAAGVLALGWQVNPLLDNEQIIQILFDTCATSHDGSNMINPPAFIEAVLKTLD